MKMRSDNPHSELIVAPYKAGVKLLKPAKACDRPHPKKYPTVADVLALPCNTYFLNHESKVVSANMGSAKSMYLDSPEEAHGKSMADTPWPKACVNRIHANDSQVIQHQASFYFEEIECQETEPPVEHLSIKLPWYSHDDKIVGIFGFGIVIGKQPLAESLSAITNLGLVNSFHTQTPSREQFSALEAEEIYLTPQESEILKLLIKGMRCPEIASQMQLSKRTVEHYTVSIKEKFCVLSKHELIEKAIHFIRLYHITF